MTNYKRMIDENILNEIRAKYLEVVGAEVPVNMKNNAEWMQKKIAEKTNTTQEEAKEDGEKSTESVESEEVKPEPKAEPEADRGRPELESVRAIQEYFGLLNVDLRNKEKLSKCDMYDSERKIIEEFTSSDLKDIDIVISKVELPDYLQPVFERYGINPEIMKDQKKLRECIMEGAETDAQKKQAEEYITQVTDYLEYYIDMKRKGLKLSQYDIAPKL